MNFCTRTAHFLDSVAWQQAKAQRITNHKTKILNRANKEKTCPEL